MTPTQREIKTAIQSKLKELYGRGYKAALAERSGLTYEAVRQYFTVDERSSPLLESVAMLWIEELKRRNTEKLNTLKR